MSPWASAMAAIKEWGRGNPVQASIFALVGVGFLAAALGSQPDDKRSVAVSTAALPTVNVGTSKAEISTPIVTSELPKLDAPSVQTEQSDETEPPDDPEEEAKAEAEYNEAWRDLSALYGGTHDQSGQDRLIASIGKHASRTGIAAGKIRRCLQNMRPKRRLGLDVDHATSHCATRLATDAEFRRKYPDGYDPELDPALFPNVTYEQRHDWAVHVMAIAMSVREGCPGIKINWSKIQDYFVDMDIDIIDLDKDRKLIREKASFLIALDAELDRMTHLGQGCAGIYRKFGPGGGDINILEIAR